MPAILENKRIRSAIAAAVVVAVFVLGVLAGRRGDSPGAAESAVGAEAAVPTVWTCSMHPQIKQPEPGKCPICAMDLIPLDSGGSDAGGDREISLSDSARKLARIQVQPVERRAVQHEVRMVGRIDYDETRLATISSWVGGRLDRLYVDYTGIAVRKGDHMVRMYSPDVLAAQEELIQARKAVDENGPGTSAMLRDTMQATLKAAREKLLLWGLTPEQVAAIETRGTAQDHIEINAPMGGIVVHKNATEGMYVKTGTPIYTIADLLQVWIRLEAYESDLPWLRYGQQVGFTVEGEPGRAFSGRVAFIDPLLDEKTRTVGVRVNVANTDGTLRPGMFVRASVMAGVTADGKVVAPDLAGKWISPMHPEVVKDEPGTCDVCDMPLVKAEDLGFVAPNSDSPEPLVIPATAPLITGRRAVVYVQQAGDESRFEGREVVLGPRAGDWYVVESGLEAGELVVVNGNFKLDSALQIVAKPSMMMPAAGGEMNMEHHDHGGQSPDAAPGSAPADVESFDLPAAFTEQFGAVLDAYLATQRALSHDKLDDCTASAKQLREQLGKVDMALLPHAAHMAWMPLLKELNKAIDLAAGSTDISAAREAFSMLSGSMTLAVRQFGKGLQRPVFRAHCPMAFNDRGAYWLQDREEIENPYFGDAMFRCGLVVETLVDTRKGGQ